MVVEKKLNVIDNRDLISNEYVDNVNLEFFHSDIKILQAFIDNNESLEGQDPLKIGIQKWKKLKLVEPVLRN